MANEYSRMDWGAGNVRRLPFTGLQGKYPYRFRNRDSRFVGPMAPDNFTNDFYRGGLEGSGTNKLAMNKGLDNWGRGNKTYDGTFRVPGFGDPNALNPWGQDWDYRDDDYDINVLDPGFNDYGPGPLYFG